MIAHETHSNMHKIKSVFLSAKIRAMAEVYFAHFLLLVCQKD